MVQSIFKPTPIPYPPSGVFSRKDIVQRTGIPDDVLGYWMKEGLLVSEVEENRRHRRFAYEQVNIAALLGVMRDHGLNIGQLRMLSNQLQDCVDAWRRCGKKIHSLTDRPDTDDWSDILALENIRARIKAGQRVELRGSPDVKRSYAEPRNRDYADNFDQYFSSWIHFFESSPRPRDEKLFRKLLKLMADGDGKKLGIYNELAMMDGITCSRSGERFYDWYWSITPTTAGDVKIFSEGEDIGSATASPIFDHVSFIGVNITTLFKKLWFPDLILQRSENSN